jgi:hypothetical protein
MQCMFIGYSLDHTADCYEMWDPATSRVYQTRYVIWLNRMYCNRVEQTVNNIVIEPDMEPIIVYHTHDPTIAGSGEGDNMEVDNQPTIDEGTTVNDDDANGIHHLPDEFFDAETEQMGNTENLTYGLNIPTTVTRSGRVSRPPPRIHETATMAQAMNDRAADSKYELKIDIMKQ